MVTDHNGILYLEGKPIQQHMKVWAFLDEWLPAYLTSYRLPGMAPEYVQNPSNNGKKTHSGTWVASVCKNTTDKGGLFLSFPEGDKPEGWFPWNTKLESPDPRTWALWRPGDCSEPGTKPVILCGFKEAMKLQAYRDNMHPIFLRKRQFTNVLPPGKESLYAYLHCTLE